MIFYSKKRPEEELTEEALARALSSRASDHELMPHLEPILASCRHETYSPMLYRVQRIGELMGLVGNEVPDPYDAWRAVHLAAQRGEPGHTELERVAFVAHLLLLEENRMRFDSPRLGLEAMETAKTIVDELDPPSGRDHLVDSASFEMPREAPRFAAMRALVDARYGNALRYNSRISEGLTLLAPAALAVRSIDVTAVVYAEVYWLYAEALVHSGQLAAAAKASRQSSKAYSTVDRHRAGVVMMQQAEILFHSECPPDESLLLINAALGHIDKYRAPRVEYGCQLLVVFYSLKSGKTSRAEAVLSKLLPASNTTVDLKRRALHGIVRLVNKEYSKAVETFSSVSEAYISLGMRHDAACIMLYWCEALLKLEKIREGIERLKLAYGLLAGLDSYETERRALHDLVRILQVATAEQSIDHIRELAGSMGGCLPSRKGKKDTPRLD